jgi:hypothetical protein
MAASTVEVLYDGTDITNHVMVSSAHFDSQINASPGNCEMTIVDRDQTMSFVTGKSLQLIVDGVPLWGGYLTSVTRKFAFPAVDTTEPDEVASRLWVLRGVDHNVLFDKRFLRRPQDYYHQLPNFDGDKYDGYLLRHALQYVGAIDAGRYFDIDATEFDVTSQIDDVAYPQDPEVEGVNPGGDPDVKGAWLQQGTPMRSTFQDFANISGAVYYIGPDKTFYYKSLEDVVARWGFSDAPNNASITGASGYQNATIGFREIDATQDGSVIVNDAMIWGGSEWAGEGTTVFDREVNQTSIDTHGRWQTAETHFGEQGFKRQAGVSARARAIVRGEPGADAAGTTKGLRYPQWNIGMTWFAHDVPRLAGVPDHLRAGDIVHIMLETFPVDQILPLRSLSISFVGTKRPTGAYDPDTDEIAYIAFRGMFSLQNSDPYTLWRFLRSQRRTQSLLALATVEGSDPAPYGALFTGAPIPATDGSTTVFELPDDRGYITGTSYMYLDGLLLRRGIEYTETNPTNGMFTLNTAPSGTSWLWVSCRTT